MKTPKSTRLDTGKAGFAPFRPAELLLMGVAIALAWRVFAQGREVRIVHSQLQRTDSAFRAVQSRADVLMSDSKHYLNVFEVSRLEPLVLLEGLDLDSNRVSLATRSLRVPTVIYSIDPDCAPCLANLPVIQELQRRSHCDVRLIGVVASDPQLIDDARRKHRIGFTVLRSASGAAWKLFPLADAPLLVMLEPQGRVLGWWRGMLSASDKTDVERKLRNACQSGR